MELYLTNTGIHNHIFDDIFLKNLNEIAFYANTSFTL